MSQRIGAGADWRQEINTNLKQAELVISCLTPENLKAPWIFYEAGVLFGNNQSQTLLCPYLFDLETNNDELLDSPLAHIELLKADREGTKKIVNAINKNAKNSKDDVDKKFERSWNKLDDALNRIPKPSDVFARNWLWKDGQKIKIHKNGKCESFVRGDKINEGKWIKSYFDKYTFVIIWETQPVSDILKLSADHQKLEGYNSGGGYVTAEVDKTSNELPFKPEYVSATGPKGLERRPDS